MKGCFEWKKMRLTDGFGLSARVFYLTLQCETDRHEFIIA